MDKPRVLILGGCGFIGRNVVTYLISNDLVNLVRIVDKVPPQVAWLNEIHSKCFSSTLVEFKSANLINIESCKNAFAPSDPYSYSWDYVINCACETKPGQTEPVYDEGIYQLSLNCAQQAALMNVKHYVELSSGNMFSSEKVPHKEDGPTEPWTFIAKSKLQVEKQLSDIPNLRYTVLRPALVYGLGDRQGLMPRIMIAAVYKQLGETMKLLWDASMFLNTVHVVDVCRAVWFVCGREDTLNQVYNVVDEACSTQGTISDILGELYNIKVDFYGNLVSKVVDLAVAADDANDKHLEPWAEACRKDDIQNTPLSPHMHPELLLHKHLNLDGTKLKSLGFNISALSPTLDSVKEIIDDYAKMKVFPSSLVP